jgi:hypothetical protein
MLASDQFMQEIRDRGIYFLFPRPPGTPHLSICIAEGLEELGIPFFADNDVYAKPYDPNSAYLFRQATCQPADAAMVVADVVVDGNVDISPVLNFLRALNHRTAILCRSDPAGLCDFPTDIPNFISHESQYVRPAGWRIPWPFGLCRDTLTKIEAARRISGARRAAFVRDFRPSGNQAVRQTLDLGFVKLLQRHFEIDRRIDGGGCFVTAHYERLVSSIGCLSYGGNFYENYLLNEQFRTMQMKFPEVKGEGPHVIRWDSWRLWESFAAGCATVMLDFEEYGFRMPVIPKNGVHYVGLKFDRLAEAVEFMADDKERLAAIGEAGRAWALEHYSPKAVATRFIGEIAKAYGQIDTN